MYLKLFRKFKLGLLSLQAIELAAIIRWEIFAKYTKVHL